MTDSVGGVSGTPASGTSGAVVGTGSASAAEEVTPGYNEDNTQSNSDGDGSGDGSVELDSPVTVMMNSAQYFQKALDARLQGFSSVIGDFNNHFLTRGGNEVDIETLLSDTQTLLLVFRGFVKDVQSLNKAQTIGLAADANVASLGRSLEIPQLRQDIQDYEESLIAWWHGDDQDPVFFSDTLSDKEASESRLHAVNTLIAQVVTAARDAKAALDSVQVQNSASSLETGEESLLKRRLENLIEQHSARLLGRKEGKSTDELRAFNKETVEEYDEAIDRTQPGVVAEALRALLTPALLARLSGLFALGGASAAIASNDDGRGPTDLQLADTAEGLALILLAEPTKTGSEENPVDQPYLGDSLSLEGANNPQAFALLLLEERMSEIQASAKMDYARLAKAEDASVGNPAALVEAEGAEGESSVVSTTAKDAAKDDSVAATAKDIAEDKLLARMQEEQRAVDAMVVESLKDAELASAVIRRHPV